MINKESFTVHGYSMPDGVDPLEIWHMLDIQSASYSLDTYGTGRPISSASESVWRIQLPDDIDEADALIEYQLQNINKQQEYLEDIDSQIKAIDPNLPTHTQYSVIRYGPQVTLLKSIQVLRMTSDVYSTDETTVDYGVLYDRCEAIFSHFVKVLSRHGRIETCIGDDLVGLTKIDWNGDFETIWEEHAPPISMRMHMKSVRLVSATRMAILRILSLAGTGALGLAIKASIPGGQYLLIPAVYKFICDMLKEFKKIPVTN